MPCEDGGRGRNYPATSLGKSGASRSWKRRGRNLLQSLSREGVSADLDFKPLASTTVKQYILVAVSQFVFVCYSCSGANTPDDCCLPFKTTSFTEEAPNSVVRGAPPIFDEVLPSRVHMLLRAYIHGRVLLVTAGQVCCSVVSLQSVCSSSCGIRGDSVGAPLGRFPQRCGPQGTVSLTKLHGLPLNAGQPLPSVFLVCSLSLLSRSTITLLVDNRFFSQFFFT